MQIDLFPGFSEQFFHVNGNRLFARVGGPDDAPPLLLIHGFPQSHLEWHPVALDLATTHRVVVIDLKGMADLRLLQVMPLISFIPRRRGLQRRRRS